MMKSKTFLVFTALLNYVHEVPYHSLTNGLKTHVNFKKQGSSSCKNEFIKEGAVVQSVNYFRRL